MNVLIVGGAGFIGSLLADALLGLGDKVVVIDNLLRGKMDNISEAMRNPNFKFEKMDANDVQKLTSLMKDEKIEYVYQLAANSDILASSTDPQIEFDATAKTTWSVLQSMRMSGVKKMFFSSTSAIYGPVDGLINENTTDLRPISYYGGAKLASEGFIKSFSYMNDFDSLIFRFPNVIGPRLTHGAIFDFVNKLRENSKELTVLGDGTQCKPYIYSADLISAILKFSKSPYKGIEIFNVGVDSATSVKKIVEIILNEMNLAGKTKVIYGKKPYGWKGDVSHFQYDLTKVHSFGWKAKYTSDEAVALSARAMLKK